jgi:hypothetical protein
MGQKLRGFVMVDKPLAHLAGNLGLVEGLYPMYGYGCLGKVTNYCPIVSPLGDNMGEGLTVR